MGNGFLDPLQRQPRRQRFRLAASAAGDGAVAVLMSMSSKQLALAGQHAQEQGHADRALGRGDGVLDFGPVVTALGQLLADDGSVVVLAHEEHALAILAGLVGELQPHRRACPCRSAAMSLPDHSQRNGDLRALDGGQRRAPVAHALGGHLLRADAFDAQPVIAVAHSSG